MCNHSPDSYYASLGTPNRVWAVSAINAEADRLTAVHDLLLEHICPGDRLVYLGNYTGYGPNPCETIEELLAFRRLFLSIPGVIPSDIVYLRGGQEEMWQKLSQLHFAPNPTEVLEWTLQNGMETTLYGYGIAPHDGIIAAREGVMSLTRWTNNVRDAVRRHAGHDIFQTQFQRAAYLPDKNPAPILFVHSGVDTTRRLTEQGDCLWWGGKTFNNISDRYDRFAKVVRGYDPDHKGLHINCVTATLDGGCGFGGSLICAGFESNGEIFELIEA